MTTQTSPLHPRRPDPEPARLTLCGETWLADPAGSLFWPREGLLVVSDLHLEKGSFFAERGVYLPPYDSRTTLGRLAALCRAYAPRRVIALGDSFHDRRGAERLHAADAEAVRALTECTDWVWITGNHDPEPPQGLGGRGADQVAVGPFRFVHEPRVGAEPGAVAGHLHPCASVRVRGRWVRRRCFAADGHRLIMPAFGAFTGGLDVFHEAFEGVFPDAFHAWMLGKTQVFPVAHTRLASPDRPDGALMRL